MGFIPRTAPTAPTAFPWDYSRATQQQFLPEFPIDSRGQACNKVTIVAHSISRKIRTLTPAFVLILTCGMALKSFSQSQPQNVNLNREWTNAEGKKLQAEYLGHRNEEVALKLTNGKIVFVPAAKLSSSDNTFLNHHFKFYLAPWQGWSGDSRKPLPAIQVQEQVLSVNSIYYTTNHFKFHCDVNLGNKLMKDIAMVFELTYHLHKHSPLGIMAKPKNQYFEARLIADRDNYVFQGGPKNSAGVYLTKERIFLAPLEGMGVESGTAGWRKTRGEFRPDTIVHELTHMLTHDVLGDLPLWVNEGYAEYISNIPIKMNSFQTEQKTLKEGIRDMFFDLYIQSKTQRDKEPPKFTNKEKFDFFNGTDAPTLYRVSNILQMTDTEWHTGRPPLPPGTATSNGSRIVTPITGTWRDGIRMSQLYHTAHLIIYYYLEIEKEKGVTKIRKFLDKNRQHMALYKQFVLDFEKYEKEWKSFTALPGVVNLGEGRVEYPAHLRAPVAPKLPDIDPERMNLFGLQELLEGESISSVGAKIEKALIEDLGIRFKFHAP